MLGGKENRWKSGRGKIFLDVMIIRDGQYGVLTRWWQKECSVRQIFNYFSFHRRSMKKSVVHKYVRHAFLYQVTIKNLRLTVNRSSYPLSFINEIIRSVLSELGGITLKCRWNRWWWLLLLIRHLLKTIDERNHQTPGERIHHTPGQAKKNKNFI